MRKVCLVVQEYGDRELKELWPQLERAIPSLFNKDEKIFPALLHGDLWSGNFSETDTEPGDFFSRSHRFFTITLRLT